MSEPDSKHDTGMSIRREILGDDHVDDAVARTSDIDRDFQRWITESVWGDLWSRPTLERRDRSLITIAILAAGGHDELELHLRAAKNTGATPKEIAEVLMHVAIYAGVPAANNAYKIMKEIYEEKTE